MLNTAHLRLTLTRNPFRFSVEDFPEDLNETIQEEFLDMIHDSSAKASFEDESLEDFWVMMEKAYPKVAEKPLSLLTVFTLLISVSQLFQVLLLLKQKLETDC